MGRLLENLRAEIQGQPLAIVAIPAIPTPKNSRIATIAALPVTKTTESGARGVESDLRAKCKTACEGLVIQPAELYKSMTDDDKNANQRHEELRAFAESLAERMPKALTAYVSRAYRRLARTLAENPSMRFTCETLPDKGDDYVLLAVGVKGAGYAVLRMPKAKFDGFKLIEMVERWNYGGEPE